MKESVGLRAVSFLLSILCAFVLVMSHAGPARAQADPATLLESFPIDQRPVIVANVDGKVVYANLSSGKLYATDGTPGGAVLLQSAAAAALYSIKAAYMVYEKSPAYLAADNALAAGAPYVSGEEACLWKTDGTPDGTVLLKREAKSQYLFIGALGDAMLYARIGERSLELWKTDGTPEGTTLVKGLSTSAYFFLWQTGGCVVKEGRCYFSLLAKSTAGYQDQISAAWITDGTTEGTVQLMDWVESYSNKPMSRLFALAGQPLYLCSGIYHSLSMGSYPDMREGGWLVPLGATKETTPWPEPIPNMDSRNYFGEVGVAKDRVVFLTPAISGGRGMWVSDGTLAGTQSLQNLRPDLNFTFIDVTNPTMLDGVAYFGAYEAAAGRGLWRTDGTAGGTTLVKAMHDPMSDPMYGSVGDIKVSGNLLFFRHVFLTNPPIIAHGELWRSDGTPEGTFALGNLHPPATSAEYTSALRNWQSIDLDGVLYFVGRDAEHGAEQWRSGGTPETTMLSEDIIAGPGDTQLSTPALVGRNVVFTGLTPAKDGKGGGMGLWSMPHPVSIVPDLVGTPDSQASAALQRANLVRGTVGAQYDPTIPKDSVLSQSVAAGTRVPRSTAVNLILSLGPEAVVEGEGEPQVEGEAPAEGEPQLEGEAPAEGEPQLEGEPQIEGETGHEGETPVLEGEPETEGESVQEGEPIPPLVAVPNVVGTDEAGVTAALGAAGFTVGTVGHAYSDEVPMGGVISQDPPAGGQAAPGSAVNLVVSLGPEPSGCPGCAKAQGGRALHLWELMLSGSALVLVGVSRSRF